MHNFKAIAQDNIITIESNTYWSCKAEGNFMLSKYSGNGSDTINIIYYEDTEVANGTVYFSFGNETCETTSILIYSTNNCFIDTNPSYIECDDKKIIYIYFTEPKETFNVSVRCFNGWTVESANVNYIIGNGEFMIITPDIDESELSIIPNNQCDGNNIVTVKLIKKRIVLN